MTCRRSAWPTGRFSRGSTPKWSWPAPGRRRCKRVLEGEFAVILLDVNMPGMDGLETAELLRQHRNARHTPIILVTAYADDVQSARGYELGVVDYIQVPVIAPVMRAKVGVFLDLLPDAGGAGARQPGPGVAGRGAHRRAAAQQRAAAGRDRGAPARRERAGGAARARASAARPGRGAQPPQGRVPGHHVARAAHAAQRDLRLDHAAAHPAPGRGDAGAGARDHRAQRPRAEAAHRGSARCLAHRHRQDRPRAGRCRAAARRRGRDRHDAAGGPGQGSQHRAACSGR